MWLLMAVSRTLLSWSLGCIRWALRSPEICVYVITGQSVRACSICCTDGWLLVGTYATMTNHLFHINMTVKVIILGP